MQWKNWGTKRNCVWVPIKLLSVPIPGGLWIWIPDRHPTTTQVYSLYLNTQHNTKLGNKTATMIKSGNFRKLNWRSQQWVWECLEGLETLYFLYLASVRGFTGITPDYSWPKPRFAADPTKLTNSFHWGRIFIVVIIRCFMVVIQE